MTCDVLGSFPLQSASWQIDCKCRARRIFQSSASSFQFRHQSHPLLCKAKRGLYASPEMATDVCERWDCIRAAIAIILQRELNGTCLMVHAGNRRQGFTVFVVFRLLLGNSRVWAANFPQFFDVSCACARAIKHPPS